MISKNPEITVIDLREGSERSDIGFNCISIPYHEIYQNFHLILNKDIIVFYCNYGIQSTSVINYLKGTSKNPLLV